MPTNIIQSRQAKLAKILPDTNLDALVLNPGPSLTYLTGLHFHLSERPVAVIFTPDKSPVIVLPELETAKVRHLPYPMTAFPYGEDPTSWQAAFQQAIQTAGVQKGKIGVEPRVLRVLELRLLEQAAQRAEFVAAEASVAALRMYKDAPEIAAMRAAVDVAQRALR
ncbi:MAG: aminopeptidase P family N-terminal domain-containing protein, partial [Chloroflexi bacterium]|nr:aminopeptidase P family N-terminal domain-containing protein [Chloroflexota bacterium]